MPKFRTKSIIVEARRLTGQVELLGSDGLLRGTPGDWLVTISRDDRKICMHAEFVSSYEPVDEEAQRELNKS